MDIIFEDESHVYHFIRTQFVMGVIAVLLSM